MEARVVCGRVALLLTLFAASLACDIRSSSPAEQAPLTPAEPAVTPPADPATDHAPKPEVLRRPTRLVLVTIDGIRWEDVLGESDGGQAPDAMPNLHRFVKERGVVVGGAGCEHDVRASGPNFVSLPGYLEMFTGKASATCSHNYCAPVATSTVIDEARAAAHREGDVAVFASWNKYAHAVARDRRAIVLSAGASATSLKAAKSDEKLKFLLEVGQANAGYPGHVDYRPDLYTARIALRYLETMTPRVLVVGLGDADEQGHRGDIPGYRRAIRRADDFLADLDRVLARSEEGKDTAVIVTTDHGRARSLRSHGASFPESQRVFVAAYGAGIAHRGVTCPAESLRLAHVAGAMRTLLALDDAAPKNKNAEENALAREIVDEENANATEAAKGPVAISPASADDTARAQ